MSEKREALEIKFRLFDGTDIGPRNYPDATTIATLKESIIAQWPKGDLDDHFCLNVVPSRRVDFDWFMYKLDDVEGSVVIDMESGDFLGNSNSSMAIMSAFPLV